MSCFCHLFGKVEHLVMMKRDYLSDVFLFASEIPQFALKTLILAVALKASRYQVAIIKHTKPHLLHKRH